MAIDPGYRTGCKIVCLDRQGTVEHHDTIYPHTSEKQRRDAAHKIQIYVARFRIEAIAVGNGTAGRETETFIKDLDFDRTVNVILADEKRCIDIFRLGDGPLKNFRILTSLSGGPSPSAEDLWTRSLNW